MSRSDAGVRRRWACAGAALLGVGVAAMALATQALAIQGLDAQPADGQAGGAQPEAVPAPAAADRVPATPSDRPTAEDGPMPGEITPELERAVAQGLEHLAGMQRDDGSYEGNSFGRSVAVTSLASLAFMADGHLPGRGGYGEHVERGLDFVLGSSTESGLLASDQSSGAMYGHGFAALFLGEVYGTTQGSPDTSRARRLHEALVKAVRLIERTQNDEGGWRYNPVPFEADVSVTICQVMALRSARDAGLEVSKDVIDKAVDYVRRCQNADGGFRYQSVGGPSAWPRSAAGVATLFYAGVYEDNAIDRGLVYLIDTALPGTGRASPRHYWYGAYYGVQAAYLAGGDAWRTWWPAARAEILDLQNADGSWSDNSIGEAYATAMALIVLQTPKRYLPIFQR